MKNLLKVILIHCVLLVTSCATIVSKSQYPVNVTSDPSGAKFTITNSYGVKIHTGQTPSVVTLPSGDGYFRKANYSVAYEKDGYDPTKQELKSSLNGWYWGNILFGGLIGLLIVDPLSGAMYKLPQYVNTPMSGNGLANNESYGSDSDEGDRSSLVEIEGKIGKTCDREYGMLKKEMPIDRKTFMYKCQLEKRQSFVKLGL